MVPMNLAQNVPLLFLRVIALIGSAIAAIIMVSSHDSVQILSFTFEAKYNDSPTFKYYVIINAVASVYTLIALFFQPNDSLRRILLILDLVVILLLDSSISACMAIGQLGKKGNVNAGWLPICNQVPKFCNNVTASLIAGFVASTAYFLIVLYSLHNVLNILDFKT